MDDPDAAPTDISGIENIRHWINCIRYGYLAAGGGLRYSDVLKRLTVGDRILAYQGGRAYVGYGIVTRAAAPVDAFPLPLGKSLEEALGASGHNKDIATENWEYAVAVDWKKTFSLSEAKTFKGVFANPNVVCKLNDPATVSFLRERFAIAEDTDGR